MRCIDAMGNPMPGDEVKISDSPVYVIEPLIGTRPEPHITFIRG